MTLGYIIHILDLNVITATHRVPSRRQYINKLFGIVREGEKLQD